MIGIDSNHKKYSSTVVRAVCAIVFCVFSFCYLYFYQSGVLSVAQHVLSGGQTYYSPFFGAMLMTIVLQAIQLVIFAVVRLAGRTHALTYLPSLTILAFVTDINSDIDHNFSIGAWWWVFPVVMVLWVVVIYFAKGLNPFEKKDYRASLFSRTIFINLVLLSAMFIAVGTIGNSQPQFHYRAKAELALMDGDFHKALRYGNSSLDTDSSLTMVRAYALSRTHLLGDKLFSFPVSGTSNTLVPSVGNCRFLLYSNDSVYRHLGAKPLPGLRGVPYLKALLRSGQATDAVADYLLCSYLVDRNLDGFISTLRAVDSVFAHSPEDAAKHLPRHYREALVLYNHIRSDRNVNYRDAVIEADYADMKSLESQYADRRERQLAVFMQFSQTYWYYYEYIKD